MTNKYIGLFWAVIVISFAGSITRLLHNEYDLFTRYLLSFYIVMQAECLWVLGKIIIMKIFDSDMRKVEKLLRKYYGSEESKKLHPHSQKVATFFRTKSNIDTYYYVQDIGIVYYVNSDGSLCPIIDVVVMKNSVK
jgi:hypothetical protein